VASLTLAENLRERSRLKERPMNRPIGQRWLDEKEESGDELEDASQV